MLINITDDIVRLQKAGILDRLLYDKTTGRNILWATDAYTELDARYERNEEIAPELITGTNLGVIKTRARKAFEQQTERTRHRAEVFTPLWIVQKMCDALDESWFGYPDVFFKDGAPTEHVRFFENSHTWLDYVDSRRMEITCGEGPFLVSRYDAANGELIPVAERVGLLDRKLRVVSENAENEVEWLTWALRAFQASYGYEWAGDNLLIARVNLLASFREHFEARFGRLPEARVEKKLANIIAWNILQMDGLSYTVPYSHAPEDQISLFESEYHPPPLCRTFNWRARKNVELKGVGTEMKFDFIIGNPPYQEETQDTSDKPIYNDFMDATYELGEKVELISPARFLFDAGKTPKAWNRKMLEDSHLKVLWYEQDSGKVFSNTDIKGGVVITYRDKGTDFGAIEHFVPQETLRAILYKVKNGMDSNSLASLVNATEYFKISGKMYEEHPEFLTATIIVKGKEVPLISKGHENDLTSNILDKNPSIFFAEKPSDSESYAMVYGREQNRRVLRYIKASYLQTRPALYQYKIVLPESNNNGTFGETIVDPFVADEGVATTQTFITIGGFSTKSEAENALKYIKGKFARAMLGTLKITQHNKRDVWRNVPLQDFTPASDIDWSKSIPEIDQQLYRKYGLDQTEIDFIESHVKEMT